MGFSSAFWARILGERGRYIGPPDPIPVLDANLGRVSVWEGGALNNDHGGRRNYSVSIRFDPPVGGFAAGDIIAFFPNAIDYVISVAAVAVWDRDTWFLPGIYRVTGFLQMGASLNTDEGVGIVLYPTRGGVSVGTPIKGGITTSLINWPAATTGTVYAFDRYICVGEDFVLVFLVTGLAIEDADVGVLQLAVECVVPFDSSVNQPQ